MARNPRYIIGFGLRVYICARISENKRRAIYNLCKPKKVLRYQHFLSPVLVGEIIKSTRYDGGFFFVASLDKYLNSQKQIFRVI